MKGNGKLQKFTDWQENMEIFLCVITLRIDTTKSLKSGGMTLIK